MIFSNNTLYNGEIYQVYFDKTNLKKRFFKDGVEVTGDVLCHLNDKYNAPRINYLKGTGKLLVGILSAGIIISTFGNIDFEGNSFDNTPKFANNYTTNEQEVEEIDLSHFYKDLIEKSGNNEQYIAYMKKPIKDNIKYLDHSNLLSTVGDLRIVEADSSAFSSPDVMGKFEIWENQITLRNDLNDSDKYDTVVHELFHYLSKSGISEYNDLYDGYLGDALNEGITQELVNEYFTSSDSIYPIGVAYTKALAEIVGKDVLLDSYFQGDLDSLISALSSYIDEDSVYTLLNNMDQAAINYDSYIANYSTEDYNNLQENNRVAWDILGKMYKNYYGEDIDNDKLMYLYKCSTTLRDEKSNVDVDFMSISKSYFNPALTGKEHYDIYYYTRYGNVIYDELDESDRFKSKSKKRS